jgi:copper ion binding protein
MKKITFLIVIAMIFVACGSNSESEKKTGIVSPPAIEVAVMDVTGMHCDGCVNTLTGVLTEMEGVKDVKVSLEYEQAKVKFNPEEVSAEELQAAIEDKGYGVAKVEIKPLQRKKVEAKE